MKALIVKLSALGDIVQALPVSAYLKSRGYHVTWVVDQQFASLVAACPFVDKVVDLPIRLWKKKAPTVADFKEQIRRLRLESFDVAFDLQGNCKSALSLTAIKARDKVGFGKKGISEWPALFATHFRFDPDSGQNIRSDYLQVVQKYFEDKESFKTTPIVLKTAPQSAPFFTSDRKKIVVAAGAQWASKELKWETLLALIQRLDKLLSIEWLFTSGTEREKSYADTLSQSVKMAKRLHLSPLPFLQSVMIESDAVLAVDSLPLHLAGMASVPTFAFFGPSSAHKYAPFGGTFIQGPCPYGVTFNRRCPRLRTCPTSACIKELSVQQLVDEVLRFLA